MNLSYYKESGEFIFRAATIEDTEGIVELFERNFKKPMGLTESKNHFRWEYLNNPVNRLYILLAISREGQFAAQYVLLPKYLRIGDRNVVCTLSQDTVTDEKFRGKGLFTSLAEELYREVQRDGVLFTYGFPNKNSAYGFFNKLKWREIKPLNIMVKPVYIKGYDYSHLPYIGNKSVMRFLFKSVLLLHNSTFDKSIDRDISVEEIKDFSPVFDEIWERFNYKSLITVIRDNRYIKWRFFDKPENNYRTFIFYKSKNPAGYLITSVIKKFGIDNLFVVDFIANDSSILKSMVFRIDEIARESHTPVISVMLPSVYRRYFYLSGYVKLLERLFPQDLHFGVRIHNEFENSSSVYDIDNWYLTWSDIDVV